MDSFNSIPRTSKPAVNIAEIFAAKEAKNLTILKTDKLPDWLAVLWVTISVLVMSYSSYFKVWPILLFYALWFAVPLLKGFKLLRPNAALFVCLSVPLLCLVSTVWSHYGGKTLYLGTAFVALNLSIWLMSRSVSFAALIDGLILGITLTLLLTVINGKYAIDPINHTYALIGLFTSKNLVGFTAELGILAALARCAMPAPMVKKLLLAVLPILFFGYCLYASVSGTAYLSLLAASGLALLIHFIMKLPASLRKLVLFISLLSVAASLITFVVIDGHAMVLSALGKDATLTGRTYLWQEGWRISADHWLLGRGYSAFWVHGQPLAERYWHEFFITSRNGFHFHSTFIQVLVELGAIGVALIFSIILIQCIKSIRACLRHPSAAEPIFLVALSFLFLIRAWVEVDFFTGPFGMGSFLFYAILPRLAAYAARPAFAP